MSAALAVRRVIGTRRKAAVDSLAPRAVELYEAMVGLRAADEAAAASAPRRGVPYWRRLEGREALVAAAAFVLGEGDWLLPGPQAPDVRGLDLTRGRPLRQVSPASPGAARLVHAVGIGMAARMRGERAVALVLFGEATATQTDFHVALNFAGVYGAPVVFACWRRGEPPMHSPTEALAVRGEGYGVEACAVDGTDALAVVETLDEAVGRARQGGRPTLVEVVLGERDPLERLRRFITRRRLATAAELTRLDEAARKQAPQAARAALEVPAEALVAGAQALAGGTRWATP